MITAVSWLITVGVFAGLLALDFAITRRRSGPVSLRAAAGWSLFYVAVAITFGVVLSAVGSPRLGEEYFAGYVVEKSLSIDNLFVFVVIMATFAVPESDQPRVLSLGIIVALVLRGAFIAAGAALLHAFAFSFAIFGAILLVTAVHLLRHRGETPNVTRNPLVARLRRRGATPALLALATMAGADILFALDSIPAVYGVTEHPFIVFSANAFALLGLRALFFLVSGLVKRLVYLSAGMAAILAFIGVKLILHAAGAEWSSVPTVSTGLSLAVIIGVLAVAVIASLLATRRRGGDDDAVSEKSPPETRRSDDERDDDAAGRTRLPRVDALARRARVAVQLGQR